jgi:hypothetical protein
MTFRCGHPKSPENTKPNGKCRMCQQAHDREYATTSKGRARRRRADAAYKQTPKRRAADAEYNAKPERKLKQLTAARRRKYGASDEDVKRLLDAQRDEAGVARCPVCGGEVNERDALDHAHGLHGPESHRGIAHSTWCNPTLGKTDTDLFDRAQNIVRYAGRRRQYLTRRACEKRPRTNTNPVPPKKRRASRRRRTQS